MQLKMRQERINASKSVHAYPRKRFIIILRKMLKIKTHLLCISSLQNALFYLHIFVGFYRNTASKFQAVGCKYQKSPNIRG